MHVMKKPTALTRSVKLVYRRRRYVAHPSGLRRQETETRSVLSQLRAERPFLPGRGSDLSEHPLLPHSYEPSESGFKPLPCE